MVNRCQSPPWDLNPRPHGWGPRTVPTELGGLLDVGFISVLEPRVVQICQTPPVDEPQGTGASAQHPPTDKSLQLLAPVNPDAAETDAPM